MKRLGFAQIPLMIALLLMALAVPVATKLVQNNQDTRNKAAHSCVGEGGPVYSGSGSCCENLEMGDCAGSGSFKVCYCKKKATNPTATPAYRSCTTWTWSNNVCTKSEYQRASNLACLPSNCTVNDPTPKPTLRVSPTPTTVAGGTCASRGGRCTNGGSTGSMTCGDRENAVQTSDCGSFGVAGGYTVQGTCCVPKPIPACSSGGCSTRGAVENCTYTAPQYPGVPAGSTINGTHVCNLDSISYCLTWSECKATLSSGCSWWGNGMNYGETKCFSSVANVAGSDKVTCKSDGTTSNVHYNGYDCKNLNACTGGDGCSSQGLVENCTYAAPQYPGVPAGSMINGTHVCNKNLVSNCLNWSECKASLGPSVTPAPACNATSNRPLDCHCAASSQCASGFCKDGRCTVTPSVTPVPTSTLTTSCTNFGSCCDNGRKCATYLVGGHVAGGRCNGDPCSTSCAGDGETAYSGHSCCAGLEQYDCVANGSFSTCKCRVKPTNPTPTPATRTCTTRTWNGNKCEVRTYQKASNLACDPSNCSPNDPTPTTIPGRCTQGATRCNSASSAFETCILVGTGSSAVTNWQGVYCRYNCNNTGCNTGPSVTPTTPVGTPRCCPKVDTSYAINTCTGASQNACGINSTYCEWKANGACSITIPIVTVPPRTCCDSCPGGTCNGSKSGDTWLHLDDACSAACICGTYHQTDNGNYACGTGRVDEPTVTPAPPTPTSAICMTPIGAKATPTVIQGTCSGSRPADVCGNTNLKVSAQCYNGGWDYDEQLCNSKGRVEFCGGKTYCCPSNGGNWTTDMTNCSQPCGACTQCPNDALAKGKGDADCSGSVTINDASVWRAEFISGLFGTVSKTTWEADFDCDGKVTLNDISIWRSNFINSLNN